MEEIMNKIKNILLTGLAIGSVATLIKMLINPTDFVILSIAFFLYNITAIILLKTD